LDMGIAKVIDKDGDRTIVLKVRQDVIQPFQAPNWMDLRVAFLLSITKAADDDDPTGLADSISAPMVADGRYWIGLKGRSTLFPKNDGTVFIAYTNATNSRVPEPTGNSLLVSSDSGVGTSNAYFWRPRNSITSDHFTGGIWDGATQLAHSINGV